MLGLNGGDDGLQARIATVTVTFGSSTKQIFSVAQSSCKVCIHANRYSLGPGPAGQAMSWHPTSAQI